MKPAVIRFYEGIADRASANDRDLTSFFVYFLTVEQGADTATAKSLTQCFTICDLHVPSRLSAYLSEGLKGSAKRYIKTPAGYRLQRTFCDTLSERFGSNRIVLQTSAELRSLEKNFAEGPKKRFLAEVIDCFEANANRAAIVMIWILALDHLFDHVLNSKLTEFNVALAANPDKRIKRVVTKEDLSELKESKFIELCRAANIISNDVRKILDDALGSGPINFA
ncbi:hypothetical protein [Rhizobium tropici]|uniref:Uncharacterized protein n=1 Tax=Rhizobium tropici TaxID=398 RepID=A0A329YHF2_RHITR|nr:hypothetical protein [Rhizobium tropici]RAX39830.1 hypothetical protein DQ393_18365 [Rhizobium tropici]